MIFDGGWNYVFFCFFISTSDWSGMKVFLCKYHILDRMELKTTLEIYIEQLNFILYLVIILWLCFFCGQFD